MKITTVQYQKVFPLAAYVNERIGLEASIDDSENPEAALAILKALVTKFHTENNPQLAAEIVADSPAVPVVNIEKRDEELSEIDRENIRLENEFLAELESKPTKADAEAYLATRDDFKYHIKAKHIIQNKQ